MSGMGLSNPDELAAVKSSILSLERAVELAPMDHESWKLLAGARLATGAEAGAFQAIERAVGIHEEDGGSWGLLGRMRLMKGEYAAAAASLEEAVRLEPDEAQWRYLLGNALMARWQMEPKNPKALAWLEQAVHRFTEATEMDEAMSEKVPRGAVDSLYVEYLQRGMDAEAAELSEHAEHTWTDWTPPVTE